VSARFFIQMNFFWHFGHSPLKKNFSAHMRKSCTFDLKKCLNYKKKEPQHFQKKKRFPKKSSASSINYCTYLSKKTLWTKICVNEWLLQKMKKKIHYRLHAYFLNFTLILAFWFKIPKYSFFFVFFKCSIYIYDYNKFLTYIPGDFCFCTVCLFKLNFRTQKDLFSFG